MRPASLLLNRSLYHGLARNRGRPRHDAQIYRAYLEEAEQDRARPGGANLPALSWILNLERNVLKKAMYAAGNRNQSATSPRSSRKWPNASHLPYIDNKIEIPDARIRPRACPRSRAAFSDVEVATAAYRPQHLRAKEQAGFRAYCLMRPDRAALSARIEDEHHTLDWRWTYEHPPRPVRRDRSTIRCLGYSERQASFIYTVAVRSGYFLRRQFNCAVQRRREVDRGELFLLKAKRAGHVRRNPVRAMPACSIKSCAKHIYRIAGQVRFSQPTGPKSPREIRRRLVMLDYVLSRLGSKSFLETDASPPQVLHPVWRERGCPWPPSNKFGELPPVSVRRDKSLAASGFRSSMKDSDPSQRFERFLSMQRQTSMFAAGGRSGLCRRQRPERFQEAQHGVRAPVPATRPATRRKTWPAIGGQSSARISGNGQVDFQLVRACPGLLSLLLLGVRPGLVVRSVLRNGGSRPEVSIFQRDAR